MAGCAVPSEGTIHLHGARRCAQVSMTEGIWNVFLSSSYGSLHVCAEKSVFCSIGSQHFGAELYLGKLCLSLTSLHLMDLIWVPLSLGFTCNKIVLTTGVSLYWLITAQVGVLFCLFFVYLGFLFGWLVLIHTYVQPSRNLLLWTVASEFQGHHFLRHSQLHGIWVPASFASGEPSLRPFPSLIIIWKNKNQPNKKVLEICHSNEKLTLKCKFLSFVQI